MSDILVLLLKKRSSDSLDVEEQRLSLDVLIQDGVLGFESIPVSLAH